MDLFYVDLNAVNSGDGSLGSPYNANDWATIPGDPSYVHINDTTYRVRGKASFSTQITFNGSDNFGSGPSMIIEPWGLDTPIISMAAPGSFLTVRAFHVIIRKCMIESVYGIGMNLDANDGTIENCILSYVADVPHGNILNINSFGNVGSANILVRGNTFIGRQGASIASNIVRVSYSRGRAISTLLDSNYLEGGSVSMINANYSEDYGGTTTVTYRNNVVSRKIGTSWVGFTSGNALFQNGGDNVDLTGTTNLSQVTNSLLNLRDMSLPGDVSPIENSVLINAGNPDLGLDTDIFGVIRNYDPNPDIGAAEYVVSPDISVSPIYKSFGVQLLDSTSTQVFRISNNGGTDLGIGPVGSMITPFWSSGTWLSDQTIAPAGYFDATVAYIPSALGVATDYIEIPSNDPETPTLRINVDGTCQQVVIGVSPSYKSFGNKTRTTNTDQTVTVTNNGNLSMVMGTLSGLAAPFTLVNNNVSGKTFYNNGDSSTVVVRYSPTVLGVSTDTLIIPSNDPVVPSFSLGVDGTCSESDISVSPASYNFGVVPCNSIEDVLVTVTNAGNLPLIMTQVSGLDAQGPFKIIEDHVSGQTIEVNGSRTLTIRFLIKKKDTFTSTLTINSNDPDTPAYNFVVTGSSDKPLNNGEGSRSLGGNPNVPFHFWQVRDYPG